MEKLELSYTALGYVKWYIQFGKSLAVTLKIKQPCAIWSILLLAIYSREKKAYVLSNICIQIFTAALFVIAINWKESKCASPSEYINTLWYIHTMETTEWAAGVHYNLDGLRNNYLEWKKPDRHRISSVDFIYINSRKYEWIYSHRKQGRIAKRHTETLEDGYVHCLDCDDGFVDV